MKFYRDKFNWYFLNKIEDSKLSSVYQYYDNSMQFFKNGKKHNYKNASYNSNGYKEFYLNGIIYSNQYKFTKKSWHRFVKMQVFL